MTPLVKMLHKILYEIKQVREVVLIGGAVGVHKTKRAGTQCARGHM